jgi:alkylation response protein AidB-like acyl-CoA dehydrogenase
MNLDLSPGDIEFRDEVRAFLRENLTPELAAAGKLATSVFIEPEYTIPWQRILHRKGWVAPHWPKEYGGTGWDEMKRYIWASECALAGAPGVAPMGLGMVGPCIIGYGTPGAEGVLPAPAARGRRLLVPGLLGAGLGL